MFDADRFRSRLAERGVSQGELARRLGISQQAISRLASGERYGSKHLHRIARELGTTPAFLTGETDDPLGHTPDTPELTFDERTLLDCFDRLDREDRAALLRIAHSMAGMKPERPTLHTPQTSYEAEARS